MLRDIKSWKAHKKIATVRYLIKYLKCNNLNLGIHINKFYPQKIQDIPLYVIIQRKTNTLYYNIVTTTITKNNAKNCVDFFFFSNEKYKTTENIIIQSE